MPVFKRFVLVAAALALGGFISGIPGSVADDEKSASEKEVAEKPATSAAANEKESKEPAADLNQVLERLNRLERELLELRIKSGKIPENKKDQRIITLVDTPYLGSVYYGSPTNLRFFA